VHKWNQCIPNRRKDIQKFKKTIPNGSKSNIDRDSKAVED